MTVSAEALQFEQPSTSGELRTALAVAAAVAVSGFMYAVIGKNETASHIRSTIQEPAPPRRLPHNLGLEDVTICLPPKVKSFEV